MMLQRVYNINVTKKSAEHDASRAGQAVANGSPSLSAAVSP